MYKNEVVALMLKRFGWFQYVTQKIALQLNLFPELKIS